MKNTVAADKALLNAFVARFVSMDDGIEPQEDSQPRAVLTQPAHLKPLYAVLPGVFPPLYEQLVLSYRWPDAELPLVEMLANPLGADLEGLLKQIQQDQGLWDALAPNGYIQFARGAGHSYDPVCFDTRQSQKDGDCRVVRIDHEEILCNYRIQEVAEVAESFRSLVLATVE